VINDSCFAVLEQLAVQNRYDTVTEARGTCLHASIEFARTARRLGVEDRLTFVRWRVRNDQDCLEHWAVAMEGGHVLDLTAVQVDGDPRPSRRLDEYPSHYVRPLLYPTHLVIEAMASEALAAPHRYPRRHLWRLHRRLFCHDGALAISSRSPSALGQAIAALASCVFALLTGYLLERAHARASALSSRLDPKT